MAKGEGAPWWRDSLFMGALLLPLPFWIWGIIQRQHWVLPPIWLLVWIGPVLEELAFRGGIQGWLLDKPWGTVHFGPVTVANLFTALIFSAMHRFTKDDVWSLLTVFPGLLFGFFRERYGQLLPVIILHSYYNTGLLLNNWMTS